MASAGIRWQGAVLWLSGWMRWWYRVDELENIISCAPINCHSRFSTTDSKSQIVSGLTKLFDPQLPTGH